MNLRIAHYEDQCLMWPRSGRHILAQYDTESIVIYQAYRSSIGNFAATNGWFGGEFSYGRMSWIKPNFLWMMYRSGWGTKPDQEVTLAVRIRVTFFDKLLEAAVESSFNADRYADHEQWKAAVAHGEVRLQWDPDHSPSGGSLDRRALQLGIRGELLREYGRDAVLDIEDISGFVAEQQPLVGSGALEVPTERVYIPADHATAVKLGLQE